jgi:hypothetical protein
MAEAHQLALDLCAEGCVIRQDYFAPQLAAPPPPLTPKIVALVFL